MPKKLKESKTTKAASEKIAPITKNSAAKSVKKGAPKALKKDPYAKREAQNYENPIYSREFILGFLEKRKGPATHEQLCEELKVVGDDPIEALRRRLIAMTRDGQLICNRRGAFAPVASVDLIKGVVHGHRDGYGFVIPEGGGEDLFLHARQMGSVFHGDRVLVRVDDIDAKGRRLAVIVEVLESNTKTIVGRLFRENGVVMVTPENPRISGEIVVPIEDSANAAHGQYVVVEITRQPTIRTLAVGKVVEILGDHMAPGMEIEVAIRSYGIPFVWSEGVRSQVERMTESVAEDDKLNRVDIRKLPLVTIDGEDARDFDDAVYCETKKGGGWRLLVAIADVAHYVKPGSALDEEGRNRGNSVYFPDHVVPMLPEILSNGLCSLKPRIDRLCMVCEMTISAEGRISGYKFYEAVMHSHARLTYTQVSAMLEHPDEDQGARLCEQYVDLLPHLHNLYSMFKVLRAAREKRGAIDFETTETRILFDESRKIEQIVPVVRNDAHKLIEECMLCANVATAWMLQKSKLPVLYRVHEGPSDQKLENLRAFLGELGLQLGGGDDPLPTDYQALLESISDRPDAGVIQVVMLRSLSQAVYSPEEKGHFGLAYPHYTHFTSPIRRYPDLIVHRALKLLIHAEEPVRAVVPPEVRDASVTYPYDLKYMLELGEHVSMTERRADEATRDVSNWLKCEYLRQHVGAVFDGVISAVTGFGFFVELSGLFVEGLVHVSSLDSDYYHFDAAHHRLVGERSGAGFHMGDVVKVRVVRVDLEDRKVDLELLSAPVRRGRSSSAMPRANKAQDRREKAAAADTTGKSKKAGAKGKRSTKDKLLSDAVKSKGKAKKGKTGKKSKKPVKKTESGELKRPKSRVGVSSDESAGRIRKRKVAP
ncbi:MAG: ribonuclease R [Hahellaceae bacterium]|nr:ribonuclease R [Hahellaceae bacterium]MCP5170013.1 ribonuclease R [Hahellaceae bacterium]